MCPDMICNMDADNTSFVSLDYKQDDIDMEMAYCTNYQIDCKLVNKKGIYGYCYGQINYKQSIKFWSRERNKYKHLMKKTVDMHLKDNDIYKHYKQQFFNAEDMMNQVRFMRQNKYQEYKLKVDLDE